jgi:formylglycine-generating enzyme required for sulfatase activity
VNTWSKFLISFIAGLVFAGCFSQAQNAESIEQQEASTAEAKPPATSADVPSGADVSNAANASASTTQASASTTPQADRVGIQSDKPTEQPFVELPDGKFMVPYTAKIPGTSVEYQMIPIRGGKFTMGSPDSEEDRRDDEGSQFEVTVKPFWMGKYEVTWAEYKKYMQMDKIFKALQGKGLRNVTEENQVDGITAPSSLYDPSFTFEAGEEPDQPAASMTQFAAKQYTKWLSLASEDFYRLPTEAEWEYACRAGTTTAFYFGDDADDLEDNAWYYENADEERHTVGEFPPNPWGLYDMYGNVAEWVLDAYNEEGYPHSGSITAEEAFVKPTKLYPRVVRGGSWELEPEDCRSAARLASHDKDWRSEDPNFPKSPWWFTDTPGLGVGFRLLRPLDVPDSRDAKEAVWSADIEEIMDDAKNRIDQNGRGAFGVVDPGLAKDIGELTDADR